MLKYEEYTICTKESADFSIALSLYFKASQFCDLLSYELVILISKLALD